MEETMKSKESLLAHRLLDGLEGIEIASTSDAANSSFGLKARTVSPEDALRLPDNSVDFIITSGVIDRVPDPIKALKEWYRAIRSGGFLYILAPHKDRADHRDRPRTTLPELLDRHRTGFSAVPD